MLTLPGISRDLTLIGGRKIIKELSESKGLHNAHSFMFMHEQNAGENGRKDAVYKMLPNFIKTTFCSLFLLAETNF